MGLFVLVCGAEQAGLMRACGKLLQFTDGWNPLVIVLAVMWISGIAAAVTNNVSFTAAMVSIIAAFLAETPAFASVELQHLMWWGLALAVCLGGNGTLVGAAANLVTVNIANKAGNHVTFNDFLRFGVPVSLCSLVAASGYITIRYFLYC